MLKTSLEWRKKNNIDSIDTEPIPMDFNNFFNCHFGGIDKFGRPVICVPFGEWDLRDMLDKGRKDELVRFLTQALEILDLTMQEMYRNHFPYKTALQHTQFTVVFDLKGFTYAKLMHKKSIDTLLEIIKLYEANYPETLGSAIIINAPWIFSTLFGMIRPLLSEHTVSKISIYDSKESAWKKAVLAVVEAEQIPSRYGGNKVDNFPI
ncbi:unnamed protein product [Orchesella dallaii]|uniref:CRAL-TRIO domain-containing protein n=1 Tax=Orchesella dallaii TaxID=48710 RepID=A0ABP1PUU2_9HEXA